VHDCRVQTPAKCTNQEKTPATRRFGQGVSLWIIGELPKKKIAVSTSYLETGKVPIFGKLRGRGARYPPHIIRVNRLGKRKAIRAEKPSA